MSEKVTRVIEGYDIETYNKRYGFLFHKNKLFCFDHKEDLEQGREYWLIDGKYYEVAKLTKKKRIALISFISAAVIALGITIPVVVVKHNRFTHFNPIPENTLSQTIESNEDTAFYSLTLKNYLTHNQKVESNITFCDCDQPSYELNFNETTYNPELNTVEFATKLVKKSYAQLNAISEVNASFGITISCISDGKIDWSETINDFKIKFKINEDKKYFIETDITAGTLTGPSFIASGGTAEFALSADNYYDLPENIIVDKADAEYNSETGKITISNPTDNVSISATCPPHKYSISGNITNGQLEGAKEMTFEDEQIISNIKFNEGYNYPSSILVEGAQSQYDSQTGKVTLSHATSDVTITAICHGTSYPIRIMVYNGTYTGDLVIFKDEEATITITPNEGYVLPVQGAIDVKNAKQEYNPKDGTIKLSNPTGVVDITAVCITGG